jgi:hypothetical protein
MNNQVGYKQIIPGNLDYKPGNVFYQMVSSPDSGNIVRAPFLSAGKRLENISLLNNTIRAQINAPLIR